MDAKYNRGTWLDLEEETNVGLADTLRTEATRTVVNEMKSILQKSVSEKFSALEAANAAAAKAQAEYNTSKEALDIFTKTFDDIVAAAPVVPTLEYYYRASKSRPFASTKVAGHWMTRDKNTLATTCTCEAESYGRTCWAQKELRERTYSATRVDKKNYDARKLGVIW